MHKPKCPVFDTSLIIEDIVTGKRQRIRGLGKKLDGRELRKKKGIHSFF